MASLEAIFMNFLVGSGSRDLVGFLGSQNLSSLPTWWSYSGGCINDYTIAIISLHLSVLKQITCYSKHWVAILSNCVVAQHTYLCTIIKSACVCLSYYHSWILIVSLLDSQFEKFSLAIYSILPSRAGIHATPGAISKTIATKWVLFIGLLLSNQNFERSK